MYSESVRVNLLTIQSHIITYMTLKKKASSLILIALVCTVLVSTPALAKPTEVNIVCMSDGSTTGLGGLLATVTELIVYLGALSAVILGAGFTMANAAKPSEEKYAKNRNRAVKYGGGSVIALYLAEALVSQLDDSLTFGCLLPFA